MSQRTLTNRPAKDQRQQYRRNGISRTQRRQNTKNAIRNRFRNRNR